MKFKLPRIRIKDRIKKFRAKIAQKNKIEIYNCNKKDESSKPYYLFIGVPIPKRPNISRIFNNARCIFINKNSPLYLISFLKRIKSELKADGQINLYNWGRKLNSFVANYAQKNNFNLINISDGYILSNNVDQGARPASLCINQQGMVNDGENINLARIIKNINLSEQERAHAQRMISLIREIKFSKFYISDPFSLSKRKSFKSENYTVLVVRTSELDSLRSYKKKYLKADLNLIEEAIKDNPTAEILYRPHPNDYEDLLEDPLYQKITSLCTVVPPKYELNMLYADADELYTEKSLAGLEALIHGLKVTTTKAPAYSNYGLTNDKTKKKRQRSLDLEELFTVFYEKYPHYYHPLSDRAASLKEVINFYLAENVKYKNVYELEKSILLQKLEPYADLLGAPLKLALYLSKSGEQNAADFDEAIRLLKDDFSIEDFHQVSQLLSATTNYDLLAYYINLAIDYVSENIDALLQNTTLLYNLVESLQLMILHKRGRIVKNLPDISDRILSIPSQDANFANIHFSYLNILSLLFQYNEIDIYLDKLGKYLHVDRDKDIVIKTSLFTLIEDAKKINFNQYMLLRFLAIVNTSKRPEKENRQRNNFVTKLKSYYYQYPNPENSRIEEEMLLATYLNDQDSLDHHFQEYKNNIPQILNVKNFAFFSDIARFFISHFQFKNARELLEMLSRYKNYTRVQFAWLLYYYYTQDFEMYLKHYNSLPSRSKNNFSFAFAHIQYLIEKKLPTAALHEYEDLYLKANTASQRKQVLGQIDKLKFITQACAYLNTVPQPHFPKGVILISDFFFFECFAMMTPVLIELKKRGFAVIPLVATMTDYQPTGVPEIDRFIGIIPTTLRLPEMHNQWHVDWDKKKVEACGINFYQGFFESLSNAERKFHVNMNEKKTKATFDGWLPWVDMMLYVCNLAYNTLATQNIPTFFMSEAAHVLPAAILRDYCKAKNHPYLSFIHCGTGYEGFTSNNTSKLATTMTVCDSTLYPNQRHPFIPREDIFNAWYAENKNDPALMRKADELLAMNRCKAKSEKTEKIIELIREKKAQGKIVACAFGKLVYDMGIPRDGGPGHSSLADWINHTIQILRNHPDFVLLIKPHPVEMMPEMTLDIQEYFTELIEEDLGDNIIILDHDAINCAEIAPHLDLALMYNGTSSMELTAKGVPVIMASYFGKHDFPVNLIYPTSRTNYEELVLSKNYKLPDEETRRRAAFVLSYYASETGAIRNDYSTRISLNDPIGFPMWYTDKMAKFLKEGDPGISRAADIVLEKYYRYHKQAAANK